MKKMVLAVAVLTALAASSRSAAAEQSTWRIEIWGTSEGGEVCDPHCCSGPPGQYCCPVLLNSPCTPHT